MDEHERLRTAIIAAYARVEDLLVGIDPVTLEMQPAVGVWSPRDVVGHLADWQGETLAAARHILGGPAPRGQPIQDIEVYNEIQSAVRGTDPWDLTLQDFLASRDELLAFLDSLSPDQLDAIGASPAGRVDKLGVLIERSARHLNEHAEQLEAWRLRRFGSSID